MVSIELRGAIVVLAPKPKWPRAIGLVIIIRY